jgi:hypothetical protein
MLIVHVSIIVLQRRYTVEWFERCLCRELLGVIEAAYSVDDIEGIGELIKLFCLCVIGSCIIAGEA